jgi:hypothetical protein
MAAAKTQLKHLKSIREAYEFLQDLGASSHLIQHVKLVGEAAEILILQFQKLGISFDADWIRLGVVFHDVGKILHPTELTNKGNQHEAQGEILLLSEGVDPKIARCCRSHGQWQKKECDFEELVVALADNLWKGKRNTELENRVITKVASLIHKDFWDLFVIIDSGFEEIARKGDLRLSRSVIY